MTDDYPIPEITSYAPLLDLRERRRERELLAAARSPAQITEGCP